MIEKTPYEMWGCFTDLKKAYKWVNRPRLWQVLRIRMGSKGSGIVDVTEALYKKKKKTTTEIDECKEPMIGLRQRAAESCMLFK